jgi:methyl-accepting chemotaxis protein
MGLRLKFNLVLLAVFGLGLLASGYLSYTLLERNAREEVSRNAGLMMESALAIRSYTIEQVRPHLELQLMRVFLPQSVPAYAATETINTLRKKYSDYGYKEATLNPTNPRNRAGDWENDLIRIFRDRPDTAELVGERDTPTGRSLYIARPIQIKNPACLACHTTPEMAPATMVKLYGGANGFGWKLNEIVGAQIVSVPMSVPIQNARHAFLAFMGSLTAVFALAFVALNVMLTRIIVRPVAGMSKAADQVSVGNFEVPEFSEAGKDEIAQLGRAFNRMRRSLQAAMKMIES